MEMFHCSVQVTVCKWNGTCGPAQPILDLVACAMSESSFRDIFQQVAGAYILSVWTVKSSFPEFSSLGWPASSLVLKRWYLFPNKRKIQTSHNLSPERIWKNTADVWRCRMWAAWKNSPLEVPWGCGKFARSTAGWCKRILVPTVEMGLVCDVIDAFGRRFRALA